MPLRFGPEIFLEQFEFAEVQRTIEALSDVKSPADWCDIGSADRVYKIPADW